MAARSGLAMHEDDHLTVILESLFPMFFGFVLALSLDFLMDFPYIPLSCV